MNAASKTYALSNQSREVSWRAFRNFADNMISEFVSCQPDADSSCDAQLFCCQETITATPCIENAHRIAKDHTVILQCH
jgi:hypothetical protein